MVLRCQVGVDGFRIGGLREDSGHGVALLKVCRSRKKPRERRLLLRNRLFLQIYYCRF